MANSDTIVALFGPGTGRNQINALTLAATTETVFVMGTDTSGTTVPAQLTIPAGAAMAGAGNPIDYNLNSAILGGSYGRKDSVQTAPPWFSSKTFDTGRPFRLRIVGQAAINAGTSNTLAINIYQGTSTTTGSDVKIAAITAGGAPSTSVNFCAEVFVQWDSTTGALGGYYDGQIGNTFTAQHALSNAATVTSAANLTFVCSAIFASTGGGTVNISEFSAEQV